MVCIAAQSANSRQGLFLLQPSTDKLSILRICGFNRTSVRRGCRYQSKLATRQAGVHQLSMTSAGRKRWLSIFIVTIVATLFGHDVARAQTNESGDLSIELVDPKVLRVCADPHNLPFSNEKLEGFENRLAGLFAKKLGKSPAYTWFPQATGFVRQTLGAHRCDVIMGFPQGDDLVQSTNPYYRTAYAFIFKPGGDLEGIDALSDERLKSKRIGIVAGTPAATYLA